MNYFRLRSSPAFLVLAISLVILLFFTVPSPNKPAAQSSLVSWNPKGTCIPTLVTIEQVLGNQQNSNGGATLEGSLYNPGIPNKRQLNPPCEITNASGQVISVFVQINRVLLTSVPPDEGDCSTRYATINGGASYPDRNGDGSPDKHCDTYRNLYTEGQVKTCTTTDKRGCMHRIHPEIDRDWKAAGYCGPGTACDNRTMFTQLTSTTAIDVQGFIFWDPVHVSESGHNFSGWEIHPVTAWRISSASLTADFTPDPSSSPVGNSVTFIATVTGGTQPYTSVWNFGDGSTGSGNPISHVYNSAGTFTASLTVTDATGATTAISKTVNISDFTLSASPITLGPLNSGTSGTSTITLSPLNGFGGTVSLSATAPAGITTGLAPTTHIGSGTSTLTGTSTLAGTYTVTVKGISGQLSRQVNVAFIFVDFAISASPVTLSLNTGDSASSTVRLDSLNGFAGIVSLTTSTSPTTGLTVFCAPTSLTLGSTASSNCTFNPSIAGSYTVTVTGTSGSLSHSTIITVTVQETNVAPVLALIGNKATNELTQLTFTATATDANLPAQTLTFILDAGAPSGPVITTAGVFTWTPTEAQGPGSYSVTIRVTDSQGGTDFETITITVAEVNIAPVLAAIGNKSVNEQTLLTFTATATDADLPANTLTFSLGAGAPAGTAITAAGLFTWTPTEAQGPGTHSVMVIVTDSVGASDSDTISIALSEVNRAPVLAAIGNKVADEEMLLIFTATATDPDIPANTLVFSLGAGAPAGAAITIAGVFTWTPTEPLGPGVYTVTIVVTDNGTPSLSDNETIDITVADVNRPPVLTVPGRQIVEVGTTLMFTVTATDPDIPANTLALSTTGLVAGMTFNTATGVFSFTPVASQDGMTFTVNFTCTDNGVPVLSDTMSVSITVSPNQVPVLTVPGAQTVNEGSLLTFTVSASDSDAGQTVILSVSGLPAGATFPTVTGNPISGTFSNVPSEVHGPGDYTVTFTASDGVGGVTTAAVAIHVNEVNQAPVLTVPGPQSGNEGSLITFTATAVDSDLPANTLTFSLGGGAPSGASINPATGVFSWTPAENQGPADYAVTVMVTDDGSPQLSDTKTVVIHVDEVNQAPVLTVPGPQTIAAGSLLTFTVSAADPDLPASTLALSVDPATLPAGASFNQATGQFSWTPTAGQAGMHTVSFRATDNGTPAMSDSETVDITVTDVPDFALEASPAVVGPVEARATATSVISVTALNGFGGTVTLTVNGPSGLGFSLNPTSITVSGTATLSLTSTVAGTFSVTVVGTDDTLTHSVVVSLTVVDFGLGVTPESIELNVGDSRSLPVTLTGLNGFSGTVSLLTSAPQGVVASVSPNTVNGSGNSTLLISGTAAGNYLVTVTATSASLTHSVTVSVQVVDYAITASPISLESKAGESITSTIITTAINGFSSTVSFGLSTSPGIAASISPSNVTGSGMAVLTVSGPTAGNYTVVVTGTSGSLSRSVSIAVRVADFTVSVSPVSTITTVGSTLSFTVTFVSINGYSGDVSLALAVSKSSATVQCSSLVVSLTPGATVIVACTFTATSPGNYSVTITGGDGSITHSATLTARVRPK